MIKLIKKINFTKFQWIKAPFNKGYVLVSKDYLKQFKLKPYKND